MAYVPLKGLPKVSRIGRDILTLNPNPYLGVDL